MRELTRLLICFAGVLLAASASPGQEALPEDVEPEAAEAVGAMVDLLDDRPRVRIEVRMQWETVQASGMKLQFEAVQKIDVQRPDRLYVETVRDDGQATRTWYQGTELVRLDVDENTYRRMQVPGTLPAMLDFIDERREQPPSPMVDFLYPDVGESLLSAVREAFVVGPSRIGGVDTSHVEFRTDTVDYQINLDLRYVGQEFTLQVPVGVDLLKKGDVAAIRAAFDELHEHRYAHHAADEPVEIVNFRLVAIGRRPVLHLPAISESGNGGPKRRPVYFEDTEVAVDCPVHERDDLAPGDEIRGPALIQEYASTTVMFDGDVCTVADTGELVITLRSVA